MLLHELGRKISAHRAMEICKRLTVDELLAVVHNPLDLPLLLEVTDGDAGQAAVDLQPLDEDALADEAEGRDFLDDAVEQRLVDGDGVLSLVLDLALRPLLLLGSFAATGGGLSGFCFRLGAGVSNRAGLSSGGSRRDPAQQSGLASSCRSIAAVGCWGMRPASRHRDGAHHLALFVAGERTCSTAGSDNLVTV